MSVFCGFDAINYLQYASFYLQKITNNATHPSLYEIFVQGFFVARDWQHAYFSSAAGDLKLEQRDRFFKGQGGYDYLGTSGDVSAVAEFKLLSHETLETKNIVNHINGNKSMGHLETSIQQFTWDQRGRMSEKHCVTI